MSIFHLHQKFEERPYEQRKLLNFYLFVGMFTMLLIEMTIFIIYVEFIK